MSEGRGGDGYFRHPAAIVESEEIGAGTRVWAFAHILPGARVGSGCNICDHVFVENDVVVGDRVTVKCGVQLWDGVRLEDDVFVGPNATFTNDLFPRSRQIPAEFKRTLVRRGASIGANATVLPGLTVGREAMVGAGAVVTHDVPARAIVVGNPAAIVGYVNSRERASVAGQRDGGGVVTPGSVAGVSVVELPRAADLRGSLAFGEIEQVLPFRPSRFFVVYNVPSREVRGEHAHRQLHQFLVCVAGDCRLMVDDGTVREEIRLDRPTIGVHLPPMVWGVQFRFSPDAVLMVLASDTYDSADYIRDYEEFLAELDKRRSEGR